jgi:carbon-monoxide dehydrogenase small subunit
MKKIQVQINGLEVVASVPQNLTLLDFLRDTLGLMGTKKSCELGNCGACTVILEGKAVNSCLVLAVEVDRQSILTIEGVRQDRIGHRLQNAFVEQGAVQCGFCTPGMILSAKALLDHNADPTDEEIKEALAGNLCRCTGYTKILAAVKSAVKEGK